MEQEDVPCDPHINVRCKLLGSTVAYTMRISRLANIARLKNGLAKTITASGPLVDPKELTILHCNNVPKDNEIVGDLFKKVCNLCAAMICGANVVSFLERIGIYSCNGRSAPQQTLPRGE